MLLITGLDKIEGFRFTNDLNIITDYMYSQSGSFDDSNLEVYKEKARGNLRRSKLFKEGILISETIEDNPNYLSDERINELIDEGEFISEEFERTMKFPNGYVAKIEYLNSKEHSNSNLGSYRSKYMRMMLFDENNQIIVDVIQDNPHFGETPYTREDEKWHKDSCIV